MRLGTDPAADVWRALGDLKEPGELLMASMRAAVITPIIWTAQRGGFDLDHHRGLSSGVARDGWLLLGEEALYGSFEVRGPHDADALRFPLTIEREWTRDARTLRLRCREPDRDELVVSFYLPGDSDQHLRFDEALDDALVKLKERRGTRSFQA